MNKRRIISGVLAMYLLVLSISMTFANEGINLDVNAKAQALNKIGMLAGDGKGNYSLSLNLKRGEAATFIVKLMGKTQYVSDNKEQYIDTDFTDVKSTDWYAAYIGYCKENAIISGIGNNNFGPKDNITEKAFLTMTMKILGYTSDDFGWSNVYQKAFEIGLVTDEVYRDKKTDNKQYTRAQVVEIMYKALGMKIKDSDITLVKKLIMDGQVDSQKATEAGFTNDQLPTAVSQITVQSDEWILVKFNEPIKPLNAKDIAVYDNKTKVALSSEIISQSDTELKIKTGTQKSGVEYGISISNVFDMDYSSIKQIQTSFIGYENKEIKSDLFYISKLEQKSSNEVVVYFTHPVNINAQQPEYYSIIQSGNTVIQGTKSNISVKVIESKINAVTINTKDFIFQPDLEYTIKITGSLISAYGTNLGLEAGDQKSFISKAMPTEKFKLSGITALNDKAIQLDFNKQVDKATSENIFSYTIAELTSGTPIHIIKAVLTDNSYGTDCGVILTVESSLDSKKAYNITLLYVTDPTRQYQIENQKVSFNASAQASSDMKVASVQPIDMNSILITFDKDIDRGVAEELSNYTIICLNNTSYVVNPIKAVYSASEPKSVRLYINSTKPMTAGYTYRINIASTYKDYTGTKIPIPLEYNFIANNITKSKPEIVKAAYIAKDTVKISFNKDIALDIPNIMTNNYYIQVINDESIKKMPFGINYIDKNTIVLKFDKIDFNNQYYFKYDKIKDVTGETYSGSDVNTAIVQGE